MWAASEGLELQTPPGTVTRQGPTPERPSMLDLTWHNFAADHSGLLSPPSFHWEASLGSDHCGMRIQWDAATPLASVPPLLLRTFDPAMDDEASETWHTILDTVLPPLWPIEDLLTPAAIDTAAASLQGVVHDACFMAMEHASWTAPCREAAAASIAAGVRRSLMGHRGGRTVSRMVCQVSEASSSMAGSKVCRRGGGMEARGVAASHWMCMPQWSEPRDTSQWKEGGERRPEWSAAKLCQVRSNVLGRSGVGPWRVTVPGGLKFEAFRGGPHFEGGDARRSRNVRGGPRGGVEVEVAYKDGWNVRGQVKA